MVLVLNCTVVDLDEVIGAAAYHGIPILCHYKLKVLGKQNKKAKQASDFNFSSQNTRSSVTANSGLIPDSLHYLVPAEFMC